MLNDARLPIPTRPTTATDLAPNLSRAEDSPGLSAGWALGALFSFAVVIGAYWTFRYGGRWAEVDSAVLSLAIRSMSAEGSLQPASGHYYPNGYLFGAVSVF